MDNNKLVQQKDRIQWIDYARAIGMFLIVIGHTYQQAGFLQNLIFAVNVPIFFILSGYLTKPQSIKRIIKKDVYTLLIPYLVATLLMFIISFIRYFVHIPLVNYQSTWYHYLLAGIFGMGTDTVFFSKNIPAIGAIWFLLAMYFGNIFYQILLSLAQKINNKNWKNTFLFLSSLIIALLSFFISKKYIFPWSINAALISVFFYTIGHLIKEYNLLEKNYLFFLSVALWLINAYMTPFWFNIGYTKNILITLLGTIGSSYAIMFICQKINQHNIKWLSDFGKCSMIALIFHVICINCFGDVNFISEVLKHLGANIILVELLINSYRIILCVLITNWLAKNKIIRKIFAIR